MLTFKRVPAAVATVGIGKSPTTGPAGPGVSTRSLAELLPPGYGVAKYKTAQGGQQAQGQAQASQSSAQQQAEDAMMAAYGDRSSLAELEAAMKAYEQQRPQR